MDCFLVAGVWWHTIISSMVTILSNIAMDRRWTAAMKSQILVKDAVNGINRHPMDGSKRFDALATICFNGGGNRSNEAGSPDRFLRIQISLVVRVFSSLNFVQNGTNSRLLQGLVPIDRFHRFFNFYVNSLYQLWLGRRQSPALASCCVAGGVAVTAGLRTGRPEIS
jgi:hypothetical protein